MADLYPLFAAILTLSVFVACYCRTRQLRRRNPTQIDYIAIPINPPKPTAPPMLTIPEEGDPIG